MIVRTVGRLILVPFASMIAALAAAAVLVSLGQERLTMALRGSAPEDALFGLFELFAKLAFSVFSVQTLLLPLLLVVIGEVGHIRHAAYYVAGGGLVMALIPAMAQLSGGSSIGGAASLWPVFATAGFVGGLVYWLLAGRRA
jgi:hypothetical protein